MRKKRLSNSSRKTRGTAKLDSKCHRFIGLSLSGGKSDKACVAILEYFPEHKKIFLSKLLEKVKTEEFISADLKIHEIVMQYREEVESVAIDVPLGLPKCMNCQLKCPGYEVCDEPEIEFIRHLYQRDTDKKKPKKMYTPYTQRGVDAYLSYQYSELDVHHALGANLAPLTARGIFISRRLNEPVFEVFTKLAVQLLGQSLKVNKSRLKVYRNSVGGEEAREAILGAISEKWGVFMYRQDQKMMTENVHAFEAFVTAYCAFLHFEDRVEVRPASLPASEMWPLIPRLS